MFLNIEQRQEDNKYEMRQKENKAREIPIEFADGDDESRQEARDLSSELELSSDDELELVAENEPETESRTRPEPPNARSDDFEEMSRTWDAAWAGLQAQVDALTKEKTSLYDQALRRQAEFDNYRKRVEREKGEIYQHARAEVLLELLPVLDNFERALVSLEKSGNDAEALRQGVELIHKQLNDAVTRMGLEPVESVGQTFDPNLHEAVTTEPSEDHEEDTIIEEFQRGYRLGTRLLRPAKVKVAASPNR